MALAKNRGVERAFAHSIYMRLFERRRSNAENAMMATKMNGSNCMIAAAPGEAVTLPFLAAEPVVELATVVMSADPKTIISSQERQCYCLSWSCGNHTIASIHLRCHHRVFGIRPSALKEPHVDGVCESTLHSPIFSKRHKGAFIAVFFLAVMFLSGTGVLPVHGDPILAQYPFSAVNAHSAVTPACGGNPPGPSCPGAGGQTYGTCF